MFTEMWIGHFLYYIILTIRQKQKPMVCVWWWRHLFIILIHFSPLDIRDKIYRALPSMCSYFQTSCLWPYILSAGDFRSFWHGINNTYAGVNITMLLSKATQWLFAKCKIGSLWSIFSLPSDTTNHRKDTKGLMKLLDITVDLVYVGLFVTRYPRG